MKNKLLLFALLTALFACGDMDGYQGDTIKLSKTRHTFEADGGNVTITTQGAHWGNGSVHDKDSDEHYYSERLSESGKLYGGYAILIPDTIRGPWFWVSRPELKVLVIHTDPNTTPKQREFTLELPDADYFGHVYIIQKGADLK